MSAVDPPDERNNPSRLSRVLQRILTSPAQIFPGRTRLQTRQLQMAEDEQQAHIQQHEEDSVDGEADQMDHSEADAESNHPEEDGAAEEHPVAHMAEQPGNQGDHEPGNQGAGNNQPGNQPPQSPPQVSHTPPVQRLPFPRFPIQPPVQPVHSVTVERRVQVDSLPFKLASFSGRMSDDADKFLNDFILFSSLNQWKSNQIVDCFRLCLQGAARIWMDQLPKEIASNHYLLFDHFKQKFSPFQHVTPLTF